MKAKKQILKEKLQDQVKQAFVYISNYVSEQMKKKGMSRGNKGIKLSDEFLYVLDYLTDKERETMADTLKAMTLLTSGNTKLFANYGQGWEKNKTSSWAEILSDPSKDVLRSLGFDINQEITKEDYRKAGVLMNLVSRDKNIPQDQEFSERKIYRGLNNLSNASIFTLLRTNNYTIDRGSSFSKDVEESWSFSVSSKGTGVLLIVRDKKGLGFDASRLSAYPGEQEVIFAGKLYYKNIYILNSQGFKFGSQALEDWDNNKDKADLIIEPGFSDPVTVDLMNYFQHDNKEKSKLKQAAERIKKRHGYDIRKPLFVFDCVVA
jgi:hypothetical protein